MQFDQLALLGKLIDHEDQVETILEGLPEDYKPVVDQMEGRDTPPSLTKLHEKLLNHEAKMLSKPVADSFPITANVAQNSTRPQGKLSPHPQQNWNQNQSQKGAPRNFKPYAGGC